METVGLALSAIGTLGSLVCFILVLFKMFKEGAMGLGIVCLVCCGIGGLIAYVYGWVKSGEWGLTNVMLIWTVCIILSIIGNVMAPQDFGQFQRP